MRLNGTYVTGREEGRAGGRDLEAVGCCAGFCWRERGWGTTAFGARLESEGGSVGGVTLAGSVSICVLLPPYLDIKKGN
jgi:hypothetical protein